MKKIKILLSVFLLLFLSLSVNISYAENKRSFTISEIIALSDLGSEPKDIKIWLPYPASDDWQKVENFKSSFWAEGKIIEDAQYGNKIFYIHIPDYSRPELKTEASFKILRKEYDFFNNVFSEKGNIGRFLKPDSLVQINAQIRRLAKEIAGDKKGTQAKARAVYDYIIDNFTYTKEDPNVCGIGNTALALKFKKGQCTEYHSVFISLLRSLKIPVKFELGFTIPKDKKEGEITGYHCWAKFYLEGKGWFPVDISEADKCPEEKDYFFGRINENRVHFSTGRDISLPFAQDESVMPLSYFIYPYIEVNGKQLLKFERKISFQENDDL